MTPHPDKPQTFRKVVFTDGSFVKIISNIEPEPGEPIIARVEWLHGKGTWPAEIIDAILDVWQSRADWTWKAFDQTMTLPSGRVICWRFRPRESCVACPLSVSSVTGKSLFDAPPSPITPEGADNYRAAIRRAISPEQFAASFASLPDDAQRRVAEKCFTEPPVRRTLKISRRNKP
jgi:hypothetical protein